MHGFETLTLAPIDRRLIDADLLDGDERAWLDAYHAPRAGDPRRRSTPKPPLAGVGDGRRLAAAPPRREDAGQPAGWAGSH